MESNLPNFDAMDRACLWQWFEDNKRAGRKQAGRIFPDRPEGYVKTCRTLANYACNKSVAVKSRTDGLIATALVYEGICDSIYSRLPEWAKW